MSETESPEPELIEVGLTQDGLRYWRAKEAMRQGELQLATQLAGVAGLQTRATAILGWTVAIALALSAAASAAHWRLPLAASAVPVLLSAVCCVITLWPRDYSEPGWRPSVLMDMSYGTELEILESLAQGYDTGIRANDAALRRRARWLRAAWVLFLAAPLVALLSLLAAI